MPDNSLLTSPPAKVSRHIRLDLGNHLIRCNCPDITWKNGKIPLDNDSVNCALCTEVFEHCPDPEAVMTEICRVLKPNGLLFFIAPFVWPLQEVPHDQYRYTPFSLQRHLTASGFTDIDLKPLGGWDASLSQMLGLRVKRRPMNRWIRKGLSYLFWSLVWVLLKLNRRVSTTFK